ncbi:hypothetical protein H5410_063930 [Solanum commersonii]|uniref:Uncharacterized protein n=1 Tax=Solanum commersonii TaxID=4109 RepID=A0A9J5WG09_SOLCO|nr:hypothetical protein H5410_063930 [Solanum commersonii]
MRTHVANNTRTITASKNCTKSNINASRLYKTKVQLLTFRQRLCRVTGDFIEAVKIGPLRLSLEKISEDIAKKTVKNRKDFQSELTVEDGGDEPSLDADEFIYLMHGGNKWSKTTMKRLDRAIYDSFSKCKFTTEEATNIHGKKIA